jgi:hypothetical protein
MRPTDQRTCFRVARPVEEIGTGGRERVRLPLGAIPEELGRGGRAQLRRWARRPARNRLIRYIEWNNASFHGNRLRDQHCLYWKGKRYIDTVRDTALECYMRVIPILVRNLYLGNAPLIQLDCYPIMIMQCLRNRPVVCLMLGQVKVSIPVRERHPRSNAGDNSEQDKREGATCDQVQS